MPKKKLKIVVVYSSKTGLTEKYARWIAEDLHAPFFQLDQIDQETLDSTALVVYGGGLYAGVIHGLHNLKKRLSKEIPVRRLIVFATGASPASSEYAQSIRNNNFSVPEQKQVPFFYFQGGIIYERMKAGDRFLMRLFNGMLWIKKLVKGGQGPAPKAVSADLCDRAAIAPLLAQARKWRR